MGLHHTRAMAAVVVVTLGLAGCASSSASRSQPPLARPEASGNEEVMRDGVAAQSGQGLTLTLSAEPELTVGQPQQLVHVAITNDTADDVLLDDLAADLQVDGQTVHLDLAEHGLTHLAPGQTAEFDENLGVRLLQPGDHVLQLDLGEGHSAPIHILVVPE